MSPTNLLEPGAVFLIFCADLKIQGRLIPSFPSEIRLVEANWHRARGGL